MLSAAALERAEDPAAAKDQVPLIEDHRLPRAHRPLGRVKEKLQPSARERPGQGGKLLLPIAGAGAHPDGRRRLRNGEPVEIPRQKPRAVELRAISLSST